MSRKAKVKDRGKSTNKQGALAKRSAAMQNVQRNNHTSLFGFCMPSRRVARAGVVVLLVGVLGIVGGVFYDAAGAVEPCGPQCFAGMADCNCNVVDDSCDVSCANFGISCSNGLPISAACNSGYFPSCGTSTDCNGDGVPDDCQNLPTLPSPEPGSARPWEVEIPISTYSTWNSRHGNVLTTIPIVSWSGRGPDMAMTLYHNSASVNSTLNLTAGMGFNMGSGWTIAYSSELILNDPLNPTTVTVVADDGTQDVFTFNSTTGQWDPPPGVYDILSEGAGSWKLTHKDQSFHEYVGIVEGAISLQRIVDATGNALQVSYEAYGLNLDLDFCKLRSSATGQPHGHSFSISR